MPRGRPPIDEPKVRLSLRLDREVVDAYKQDGPGYQTRINADLRKVKGIGDA